MSRKIVLKWLVFIVASSSIGCAFTLLVYLFVNHAVTPSDYIAMLFGAFTGAVPMSMIFLTLEMEREQHRAIRELIHQQYRAEKAASAETATNDIEPVEVLKS